MVVPQLRLMMQRCSRITGTIVAESLSETRALSPLVASVSSHPPSTIGRPDCARPTHPYLAHGCTPSLFERPYVLEAPGRSECPNLIQAGEWRTSGATNDR